jgi:1,4-dihydroxy-2-naphthoyl-CoA hydrolase
MSEFTKKVYLADTDAAGRIFYSRLLEILHEAYEEFLEEIGFSLSSILKANTLSLPITHVEIDFYSPISLGSTLKIKLKTHEIRQHSFCINYLIDSSDKNHVAWALTVHTAISNQSGEKIALPDDFKHQLENHR